MYRTADIFFTNVNVYTDDSGIPGNDRKKT